jgi:hypothetical protein
MTLRHWRTWGISAAAAGAWAAAITADTVNAPEHIWAACLAAAAALTLAALIQAIITRAVTVCEALTRAILNRPLTRFDTGPMPRVPPQLAVLDGHGKHAAPAARPR